MRHTRKIFAGALGALGLTLGACSSGGERADAGAQAGSAGSGDEASLALLSGPGATLLVHGLSCPLCATNVDKQLKAIPGVRTVNVNLGTGEIRVGFGVGASPSDEQLAHAVTESGFTLVRIERD